MLQSDAIEWPKISRRRNHPVGHWKPNQTVERGERNEIANLSERIDISMAFAVCYSLRTVRRHYPCDWFYSSLFTKNVQLHDPFLDLLWDFPRLIEISLWLALRDLALTFLKLDVSCTITLRHMYFTMCGLLVQSLMTVAGVMQWAESLRDHPVHPRLVGAFRPRFPK